MDRYFDKPDAKFDLDIFEESIDLLIKYNDRDGVTTFWRLMEEMNVEPPEELREKVFFFFFFFLIRSILNCKAILPFGGVQRQALLMKFKTL